MMSLTLMYPGRVPNLYLCLQRAYHRMRRRSRKLSLSRVPLTAAHYSRLVQSHDPSHVERAQKLFA